MLGLSAAALFARERLRRTEAVSLGGGALLIAAWLCHPFPGKLLAFLGAAPTWEERLSGLRELSFYPVQAAAIVSWPVVAWTGAGVALALRHWRDPRRCAPVLCALLLGCATGTHPDKRPQDLLTFLPILYVLAELAWHEAVVARVRATGEALLLGTASAALVLVLLDPRPALREERRAGAPLRPVADVVSFLASQTQPDDRTLVLGGVAHLPHELVEWETLRWHGAGDPAVGYLDYPGSREDDPRYREGYPVHPSPAFAQVLDGHLRAGEYDRVVSLSVSDDSVLSPPWQKPWDAWSQNYVRAMAGQTLYPLQAAREFPELEVTARLYVRPEGRR
jgi:hypothetical protein